MFRRESGNLTTMVEDDEPLSPPVDATQPPRFHEMNENPKRFERMAVALICEEPTVRRARIFGIGGQAQFGIDAIGLNDDGTTVVGSSKCYEKVTTTNLRKWSKEFLDHYDERWKKRRVTRFILTTAATNATDTKILEEIEAQEHRFADLGIDYEVWAPEELTSRLQKNRLIAQRFLGETWANLLCGPKYEASPDAAAFVALSGEIASLQGQVSAHVSARLEAARDDYKLGNYETASALIAELRDEKTWLRLEKPVQASALRLAGSLALLNSDLAEARSLCAAALAIEPTIKTLAARIASKDANAETALKTLGAPTNVEERQLQTSLMLEAGDRERASELSDELLRENANDPENLCLRSLAFLLEDQRREALESIKMAEAKAPNRLSIIRAGSVIRYANAVTPIAPQTMVLHPNPIAIEFIKTDDVTQAGLREALAGFEKLMKLGGGGPDLPVWKLGCLANILGEDERAASYCASLLGDDPLCTEAIAWATLRDFGVDLTPSRDTLLAGYAEGSLSGFQITAMIWLLLSERKPEDVEKVLSDGLPSQPPDCAADVRSWIRRLKGSEPAREDGEIWASTGAISKAITLASAQDYSEVEKQLGELLRTDELRFTGFQLASDVAARGWWTALSPYVTEIAAFGTAPALSLATHIVYHTKPPAEALECLARWRAQFPGGELPDELRRMEIAANLAAGHVPTAIRLSEKLSGETDLVQDRLYMAQCHLAAGDGQACIPIVRRALLENSIPSSEAIMYSIALARDDLDLSQSLWRRAVELGVPDNLLLPTLGHAFKIGLDAEIGPLTPRLHQRSLEPDPDVWQVTVEDVVEQMRAHRQNLENVVSMWEAGAIPIHLAPQFGPHLAEIYDLEKASRAEGPMGIFYIRNGARPLDITYDKAWPDWTVHLDITAMLIADQLDLLDHLEALDAPVRVSRQMTDILLNLESDTTHQQIARVKAGKDIIAAYSGGRLEVASAPFGELENVQHERKRAERAERGPTLSSLKKGLVNVGAIEGSPEADAAAGGPDDADLAIVPASGDRLVFEGNTLESLTVDGHLDAALANYRCEITQEAFDRIVQEVTHADAGEALADRISRLRRRFAAQLKAGRYEFIPDRTVPTDGEEIDKHRKPVEQGLIDLISAPATDGGVLWIDDRHLNGYANASGNQVVGVVEVLRALLLAEKIDDRQYREKLRKLREGGAAFIPMAPEEVLPLLNEAAITNGRIVERPALSALRRNFSVALHFDRCLKIGDPAYPSLEGRPDEIPFLLSARRLAEVLLRHLWSDPSADISEIRARATWVWESLRVEQFNRPISADDPTSGRELIAAMLAAGSVAVAQLIYLEKVQETLDRRKAYLAWLEEVLIARHANPAFWEVVAAQLKGLFFLPDENTGLPEDQARLVTLLREQTLLLLPDQLAQPLLGDPEIQKRVGVTGGEYMVGLNGLEITQDEFRRALVRTIQNGRARLTSTSRKRIDLEWRDDHIIITGATKAALKEPFYPVLRAAPEQRTAELRLYFDLLDLPADLEKEHFSACQDAPNALKLLTRLQSAQETSVVFWYASMEEQFKQGREPSFLPPPAERLIHHLGLDGSDSNFEVMARDAWDQLSEKVGPQNAFRRLAGLPVNFADHWRGPATSENGQLDPLRGSSPMAMLHLAAIAWRQGGNERADGLIDAIAESLGGEVRLFTELLRWSHKAFQSDPAWKDLHPKLQLALIWSHAHRVTSMMVDHRADMKVAPGFFVQHPPDRTVGQILCHSMDIDRDYAAPDSIQPAALLCHGLTYVFGNRAEVEMARRGERFTQLWEGQDGQMKADFMFRSDRCTNLLDSFLNAPLSARLSDGRSLSDARQAHIESALGALDEDPNQLLPWSVLARYARAGLSTEQANRVKAAFNGVSLEKIRGQDGELQGCRLPIDWRLRFGDVDDSELLTKLRELASSCAARFPGGISLGGERDANRAFTEVVEAAAACSAAETPETILERLNLSLGVVVDSWPASANASRSLVDALIRQSEPAESGPIWQAFNWLRTWR